MENKFKEILFSIYIFLFSLVTSVIAVVNTTSIYKFCITKYSIESASGVKREVLINEYTKIIRYLRNPFIKELNFENFPMSYEGKYHFFEVKNIIFTIEILFCIFLIIGIILFILYKRKKFKFPIKSLSYMFNFVIVGFFSLLVSFYFDFSYVFNKFHEILFNNDYWIFDERKDPIIKALPEEFFMVCGVVCILIVIIISIISKLIYLYYKNKIEIKMD